MFHRVLLGILAVLLLAAPAQAGWLVVKNADSDRAELCLPASQVQQITLISQRPSDKRPMASSFVIKGNKLAPSKVVLDQATFAMLQDRYLGRPIKKREGKVEVDVAKANNNKRLKALTGKVSKGVSQVLMVETQAGHYLMCLKLLGPGGTPYFIGISPKRLRAPQPLNMGARGK